MLGSDEELKMKKDNDETLNPPLQRLVAYIAGRKPRRRKQFS